MDIVRTLVSLAVVLSLVSSARGAAGALDGACTTNENCIGTPHAGTCTDTDSTSTLDTCKCDAGYTANVGNTACQGAAGALDGACDAQSACTGTLHAGTCTDTNKDGTPDTCKCSAGYTPNPKSTTCIVADGYLEGNCTTNGSCSHTPHAETCTSGKCKCNTGFTADTTLCKAADGYLEGACLDGSACIHTANASTCTGKLCKCDSGFTANSENTTCLVNGALGGKCTAATECVKTANAGTCTSAKCACDAGFILNPAKTACLAGDTGSVSMASIWIVVITSMSLVLYL
ncbi:latent-transforming growth factor beta-binding protein 2-like isoform X2 [Dreissena polymorpha]|uniref:latent-transforming growth factor beta-binding protein 2-like isoform X2 n=1 Tax=Dreissena polymorpha TaxID=45954 RepID=UPI0022646C10|nr:latent-transforming growth factor beta-binding protein 2-like isoform X2 [Dreissena polymorpha]